MRQQNLEPNKPFFLALLLFFILLAIIVIAGSVIDVSKYNVTGLLFLTTFVCCALIAKSVYDSLMVNEQIARTEERIVKSISIDSEELHTQLYQNSPVPYMLLNEQGIITSANMAAGRLYGKPPEKLVGETILETIIPENENHISVLMQKYETGVPVGGETVQVHTMEGDTAWVLLSLFPYRNAYGEKIGLLTLVDITKQKQIENAKAEFVSLASHQLRTPIAGIKWSAELLQLDPDKKLDEKQRRYIDRLLVGVKRMALLVDDFLRVSRFELGTFQPEYTKFDLEDILRDVVKEQEEKVAQKEIEIRTFFDKSLGQMYADQNLVRMILSNLFSNAVKYTRSGGTIHIGYKKIEGTVHISVVDNGMGIPARDQERIFTKLFRASNASRNVPDGTGLGLYIAKEAVKVLKGTLSFDSVENVSTTFKVVLPID